MRALIAGTIVPLLLPTVAAVVDPATRKEPTAAEMVADWKASAQGQALTEVAAMGVYTGFLWALVGRYPKPFCFHGNAPQTGHDLLRILDAAVDADKRMADVPYGEALFVSLERLYPCPPP